jgi:hypothetical protein
MGFTVKVTYRDGSRRGVDRIFRDLDEAARVALALANDIGRTYTDYVGFAGFPLSVVISDGSDIVLRIRVIMGGLSSESPPAGLVDLPGDDA